MPILAATTMPPLFALLAIMLVGVVVVSLLLSRIRQSLLVGYFLCGVFIANSGVLASLGSANTEAGISQMAEFGVILLLFTLGLEFSLSELRFLRRLAFVGGSVQMVLCTLPITVAAVFFGVPVSQAIVLGVAMALSSTAISLKTFQDMELSGSPGARLAVGVAIFQDIFVIAFFLVLPLLFPAAAGASAGMMPTLLLLVGKGLLFVGLSFALAKWVIPRLLHAVADTRSRELFTLTVVGLCVGLAFLGGMLELSLALGAFVAGLAVSDSIYRHRILADVMPLKDLFLTLFFVSVGLMIDLRVALRWWPQILLATTALMFFKSTIITLIGRGLSLRTRPALLGALSLSGAGEFGLVLMQRAGELQPWSPAVQQVMLASTALSMGLIPFAMKMGDPIADLLKRLGLSGKATPMPLDVKPSERIKAMSDHAIVCGYGPVGQRLVEALDESGVPSIIVDLNAETVRRLHKAGRQVLFADAAHSETWDLAGIERARLIAFTFPDTNTTTAALPIILQHNREVTVIARAKFAPEAEALLQKGVHAVIHDEAESGRAVVREALHVYEEGQDRRT
ncbi:MAG: cation:proton antiporter [Verrucomicrobiaceae bacterium]|nr:cation:proton antiporter [Verrucomicrobiaceae bacterium]